MIYYAVIDTNVLVSALLSKKSNTATVGVINAIHEGKIIPLYNEDILDEYSEVLHRKKFKFPEVKINNAIKTIVSKGVFVNPAPTGAILVDMKDLVFYEVVMEKRTDNAHLVTGNKKHFPARKYIVTPAEMMEKISQG